MTTSVLQNTGIFGIAQGLMPRRGPKALTMMLDLTAGPTTFDITGEIMRDELEFVQSVFIDNPGNVALVLLFAVTQHRVVCPSASQGVFGIIAPTGPLQVAASGPAARFNLIFTNMPFAPSVYKLA